MKDYSNFYGSNDPRDVPHYGVTEAVSIIPGIPKSTLRNWFNGENPTLAPSDVKPLPCRSITSLRRAYYVHSE